MPNTPNLGLPLLAAAQAQKHVTHNEALVALDTLVQLGVLDKDLTVPPASPSEGDRYLIAGASPTGAWNGWGGRVARFQDGRWTSYVPKTGWLSFVVDEGALYTYNGSAWGPFSSAATILQNLVLLGIGTTADATNPFSAKLNKALWTAKTVAEGGTGDLRYTLNKEASAKTLSFLLQSAFSGRAEIGLAGDDDLHVKVSGDGATWTEAVRIDRATGGIGILAASTDLASAATTDLGSVTSLKVDITGTTAITSFGTRPNAIKLVRFAGALTLTHNSASLILPGGANIATAAGDTAIATSDGSGNWRIRAYQRADGTPVSTAFASLSVAGQATAALGSAAAPAYAFTGNTNTGEFSPGANTWAVATGGVERVRVDSVGQLGIGSAPSYMNRLTLATAAAGGNYIRFTTGAANNAFFGIDGGGPELVGGAGPGDMVFRAESGSFHWGKNGGARVMGLGATGALFPGGDNTQSIGDATHRWSTVYAGTGTINTSDARQKAVRGEMSADEIAAWAEVRPQIFQFLDAVAAKGEDHARLHAGYTAQAVRDAFAARGLDPARYALWCADPLMRSVKQIRTVVRPKLEMVEVEEVVVVVQEGRAVRQVESREEARPVTERLPVHDQAGDPIPDLFHDAPVMESVEETYDELEPTGEVRLGLRYDQCLVVEAAYLRSELGALRDEIAALKARPAA